MNSSGKKLRICIVSAILPPAYGGAEVAAFKYANRLHNDPGSEVTVIGWDRTGAYRESKVKYEFIHSVEIKENPDADGILIYFQQINHLWNCFRALLKPMYRLRNNFDYIHNFNSGFAFNRESILIGKMLGKKVITETSLVGDDDPVSLGRFPDWKDYFKPKYLRYKFYKMADRFVSKSEVITEIFEKSEIPMRKVVQIPYSVDVDQYKPVSKEIKSSLRQKLGLWSDGRIILFVGGINVRKGVHLLIDAFINLEKKYPDVNLLIAGPTYKYDKSYISEIKEKISDSKLSERVKLTEENISNVDEYMQSSDIFVLPSKQEGFPISVLEAMSSGLVVIGSDIPEIAKAQICDGKDGYIFPSGDSEKLTQVLEKVLNNEEENIKITQEARSKVISKWSTEIVDRSYREMYQSI